MNQFVLSEHLLFMKPQRRPQVAVSCQVMPHVLGYLAEELGGKLFRLRGYRRPEHRTYNLELLSEIP